jgi:hypothetical protein
MMPAAHSAKANFLPAEGADRVRNVAPATGRAPT